VSVFFLTSTQHSLLAFLRQNIWIKNNQNLCKWSFDNMLELEECATRYLSIPRHVFTHTSGNTCRGIAVCAVNKKKKGRKCQKSKHSKVVAINLAQNDFDSFELEVDPEEEF